MDDKPKTLAAIVEKLYAQYRRNPHGWRMYVRQGRHGFGDIFVGTSQGEIWQLKVDSLYRPSPCGVGQRLPADESSRSIFDDRLPSYGFRPLTSRHMESLSDETLAGRNHAEELLRILRQEPTVPDRRHPALLHGPIVHTDKHGYLSEAQRKLERKLENALTRIVGSKGYLRAYG